MKSFRHSSNERNTSNVLKLRLRLGAAGYGVYMMLLERLAEEPQLRAELDYDILAYDFHVEADMIRQVVEDFDLFEIDLDMDCFSNKELNRQLTPKAKRAQQEQILDKFISARTSNPTWLDSIARNYKTTPERIRAILQTSFRDEILANHLRIPDSSYLCSRLSQTFDKIFRTDDES